MNASFLDTQVCKTIGSGHHNGLEQLRQFQLAGLRQTLSRVKRFSRFYKKHLKDFKGEDITGFDEFAALPFTFARHIQGNSHEFLCVSQDSISRVVTLETSGTTAAPKRIFFTDSDLEQTIDFFSTVLSQLLRPDQTVLILLPGNTPASAGDLLKTAMARIRVKGIVHGIISDFNEAVSILKTTRPSMIIGLPVQVLALCELSGQKNLVPESVRHVILTSDHLSSAVKYRIEQILNCRVFDHYGMTETGFGGGIDCCEHTGYHLRETDLFFEIVDPDTGSIVPRGQWGEITVTTLGRRGMPLVRYRTGDLSRFLCDPCPCGSGFRRMDYIRGRYSHTIDLPRNLRIGMPDLDDIFFTIPGVVDFDAAFSSRRGKCYMDITLKTLDISTIQDININKILSLSPVVKTAVETGALRFGPILVKPFKFVDTYTGKRRIDDTPDKTAGQTGGRQ